MLEKIAVKGESMDKIISVLFFSILSLALIMMLGSEIKLLAQAGSTAATITGRVTDEQ